MKKRRLLFRDLLACLPPIMAAGASIFLPAKSFAVVQVPEGALSLHSSASARYDSNIFANANEHGDAIFFLSPELQYIRQKGLLNLEAWLGVDVIRFSEFSGQDSEDFFASASFSYPNRLEYTPLFGAFDIGWRQRSATNEALGVRIQSDTFSTRLRVRNDFSQKLALRGLSSYSHESFRRERFGSSDSWAAAGEAVWVYSEKLELFSGYRFRHTRAEGERDNPALQANDHLLNMGAEGQLLPKVSGRVSLGAQMRHFERDSTALVHPYGLVTLHWNPRERSRVTLGGEADFEVAPDGRSADRTTLSLLVNQRVYGRFSVEPALSWASLRFRSPGAERRDDNAYGAGVSFIYDVAGAASMTLRYSYQNRHSDDAFFNYDRHRMELSARITF